MKYPKFLLLFVLAFVSCKSTRTLTSESTDFSFNKKQVVREHKKLSPDFKTLQAKIKISYRHDNDESSYSATLRIEKDQAIWINSTLSAFL